MLQKVMAPRHRLSTEHVLRTPSAYMHPAAAVRQPNVFDLPRLVLTPKSWAQVLRWMDKPPRPTKALLEVFRDGAHGDHDPPIGA